MRKIVGDQAHAEPQPHGAVDAARYVDVEASARVAVTSEDPAHPVENAFDGRGGPGATEWIASGPGPQTLSVIFDSPRAIRAVLLEIETAHEARTQEIELAVASGSGAAEVVLRQEFNFSAGGATFERERWVLDRRDVREVRLRIRPDKGGGAARARVTSLRFEEAT